MAPEGFIKQNDYNRNYLMCQSCFNINLIGKNQIR